MGKEIRDFPEDIRKNTRPGFPVYYYETLRLLADTPADVWIHARMLSHYPALRGQIETWQEHTYAKAHRCIGPRAQNAMPASAYQAANLMNASFAAALDLLLETDTYAKPYRENGFDQKAKRLSDLNPIDRGHAGDMHVRDAWAKELGLLGWYEWVKFR
jgi:hypothetical protein